MATKEFATFVDRRTSFSEERKPMNGRELEHLLSAIDENILLGKAVLRREILSYFRDHEFEALTELRTAKKVTVPTSSGPFEIKLADLQTLVA